MESGETVNEGWGDVPRDPNEFYKALQKFHIERGTVFDATPKVNMKPIDLYRLFGIIQGRGGYDVVSAEKLAWRKIGTDFGLGQANAAAYAFALKTTFYRYLAAYAIKNVYKQEPPPKEILENITAKGGDLLHRTMENFRAPQGREQLASGQESDVSDDELRNTPKFERMDLDDPGSGGGRSTRGLRQAPPQRVFFQPEVSSSRQRPIMNHAQSPQPVNQILVNNNNAPTFNPNSTSFNIATYEPRQPVPLSLRPVVTPASNSALFRDKVRRLHEAQLIKAGKALPSRPMMLPGTGFDGPNIYMRTMLALRSGIESEVEYALHHLVKISHERGDKYKFEAFPGLADVLVEKVLEVASLFYDARWRIDYSEPTASDQTTGEIDVLNGMSGTPDILARISKLKPLDLLVDVESDQVSRKLLKCNEAGLVIRNMCMLEDNARYLSEHYPLRDFLTIALNLPNRESLVEIKHYVLDITEQLSKYWPLKEQDPLYLSLLGVLAESNDRGASVTALKAISRIGLNPDQHIRLANIPLPTIVLLLEWIQLDDEELVGACLDFLYQFTMVPENVVFLLKNTENGEIALPSLMKQLGRLLLFNAHESLEKRLVKHAVAENVATEIPNVPTDLMEEIVPIIEPERSSAWLRSLFEENSDSDITQIALWQAYQTRFTPVSTPANPLLAAAEFIKNVSQTFPAANAQVINGPNPRFIIKGIRPRHVPTDTNGRPYIRCLWTPPGAYTACGTFHATPAAIWEHVVTSHLGVYRNEAGKWDLEGSRAKAAERQEDLDCHWARCKHFTRTNATEDPIAVGMHVKTHLPDTSLIGQERSKHIRSGRSKTQATTAHNIPGNNEHAGRPAEFEYIPWADTAVDERGEATGLPMLSALVLKSLSRNIPRAVTAIEEGLGNTRPTSGEDGWMQFLFGPIMDQLWHVIAVNRALGGSIWALMGPIERGIKG